MEAGPNTFVSWTNILFDCIHYIIMKAKAKNQDCMLLGKHKAAQSALQYIYSLWLVRVAYSVSWPRKG